METREASTAETVDQTRFDSLNVGVAEPADESHDHDQTAVESEQLHSGGRTCQASKITEGLFVLG
jgi:hypothetical protein